MVQAFNPKVRFCNLDGDASCVLCQEPLETIDHLFFKCPYSRQRQVWETLMKGIMHQFTVEWESMVRLITANVNWSRVNISRYILQSTIHAIWMERNMRRHNELPSPSEVLIKSLDKNMRNRFTLLQRKGNKELIGEMAFWFESRQSFIQNWCCKDMIGEYSFIN